MESAQSLIEQIISRQLWQLEDIGHLRRSHWTPYLKKVNKISDQGKKVIRFLLWCYTLHTRGRPNITLLVAKQHHETLLLGLQEHMSEEKIEKLKEEANELGVKLTGDRPEEEWDLKQYDGKTVSHNKHYEYKMVRNQIDVMVTLQNLNSKS